MTAEEKIGRMWLIYDRTVTLGSGTTYATLLIALQSLTSTAISLTSSGEVRSTSAKDRSVEFFSPNEAGTSQADLSAFIGRLRDLYYESNTALVNAGIASPTDLQIWEEMKSRLQPVREHGPSSFVSLYCAQAPIT